MDSRLRRVFRIIKFAVPSSPTFDVSDPVSDASPCGPQATPSVAPRSALRAMRNFTGGGISDNGRVFNQHAVVVRLALLEL
jgi:hypothetical protein